jgi:hypothetical protein
MSHIYEAMAAEAFVTASRKEANSSERSNPPLDNTSDDEQSTDGDQIPGVSINKYSFEKLDDIKFHHLNP